MDFVSAYFASMGRGALKILLGGFDAMFFMIRWYKMYRCSWPHTRDLTFLVPGSLFSFRVLDGAGRWVAWDLWCFVAQWCCVKRGLVSMKHHMFQTNLPERILRCWSLGALKIFGVNFCGFVTLCYVWGFSRNQHHRFEIAFSKIYTFNKVSKCNQSVWYDSYVWLCFFL